MTYERRTRTESLLPSPFADLVAAIGEREVREQEATRWEGLETAEHEAPAGDQNTAAWVIEHRAAYLDIHPGTESARQLDIRDDLLVDLAADGRVVGIERIGWLVMAADLVEVLAWLRVSGRQFYRATPAEVPSAD